MDDFLSGLPFAKGHGTGNDFVIVPDPTGELDLSAAEVRWLCDRRSGLGGDGVLRVVRTAACPPVAAEADRAEWFMDYRNADGSLAEMCGNGARVFARYLVEAGLATGPRIPILTRAGLVVAEVDDVCVAVDMPMPKVYGQSSAHLSGVDFEGTVAFCGNPNLVCFVDDPDVLNLTDRPRLVASDLPDGANVEFVAPGVGAVAGDGLQVRMRVVERGVGETLSCGSGACAVAGVVLRAAGLDAGTVTVDVPGGRLAVTLDGDRCTLRGPAVIVATGRLEAEVARDRVGERELPVDRA